jgi:hypothetical protein
MTEEELQAIEVNVAMWSSEPFAVAGTPLPDWMSRPNRVNSLLTLVQDDVPDLVAEVRRLQDALEHMTAIADRYRLLCGVRT